MGSDPVTEQLPQADRGCPAGAAMAPENPARMDDGVPKGPREHRRTDSHSRNANPPMSSKKIGSGS